MWHVGIDLHLRTLVVAAVNDAGEVKPAVTLQTSDTEEIVDLFQDLRPFRAVIEATSTYRWLYDLLSPLGQVVLAHPLRLRAMTVRRSKSDRLDSNLLAQLLRLDQVPLSYVPPEKYQMLRDLVRYQAQLGRQVAQVKTQLKLIIARRNIRPPYKSPFGPKSLYWFSRQDLGEVGNQMRDHLMDRLANAEQQQKEVEAKMTALRPEFPQVEALLELYGVGLFTALMVVAEFGEVERFGSAKQAAAYTGLTTRVYQSGETRRTGHISKQGSPWLRWVLVEAAMKLVKKDEKLANFYQRIRRRSSSKIARVAAARKLAEICWYRLRRWERTHQADVAA